MLSPEVKDLIDKLGRTVEEFKSAHKEEIEQVKRGFADVITKEKVDRINQEIGNIQRIKDQVEALEKDIAEKIAFHAGATKTEEELHAEEHQKHFENWVRKGEAADAALTEFETKDVNITTPAEGGHAVPEQLDREILSLVQTMSPLRQFARVIRVGTTQYKKLVNTHGATSGWVGETDARPSTETPALQALTPFIGEVYAEPVATQQSLEDIFFDVEEWLREEVSEEFAIQEGASFINGNGTNKPRGFLQSTITDQADNLRAFGTLQRVKTGVAGGFKAVTADAGPGDTFIDVIYSMKSQLRMGAAWLMNSLTMAEVRKFRDAEGNYLWRAGLQQGQPASLLGYPVGEMEDMPGVAANNYPVAFGNWRRGYYIVDYVGTSVLRDPYTSKGNVKFYTRKRVGGFQVDSQAIKLIQIAL